MNALATIAFLTGAAISMGIADQVRVTVRIVEMPQTTVTALLADPAATGKILHETSLQLVTAGKAQIVETAVLTCRSGHKASIESIAELIYPTEADGYDMPPSGAPAPTLGELFKTSPFTPYCPTAFEVRNVGSSLEITTNIGESAEVMIDLEHVARDSYATWHEFVDEWGDSSIRFPIFETLRVRTTVELLHGEFQLINLFTPKPAAIPAVDLRRLVFIGAQILSHPTP